MNNSLNPYDFERKLKLESYQQVNIRDYLRIARNGLKKAIVEAQMAINGYVIELCESKTKFGGKRLWFVCPLCRRRCGVISMDLSQEKIMCRKCYNLFA